MTDRQRPDGSEMIGWGWALIAIGALLLLIGVMLPTFSDSGYSGYLSERAPTINPWKWPLIWLGIGLPNLGVVVLLVGHLVRAIWFLPGRDVKVLQPQPQPTVAPTPPQGALPPSEHSAADAQDATLGKVIWIVTGVVILTVLFFIFIIGGRAASQGAPANLVTEQLNKQDPALDGYGDQTTRKEGR